MEQRSCEPRGYDPKGFYPKKYELTPKDLSRKSVKEELQEAGYLPRENEWTQTGPLAPLWKLPYPLNSMVLTLVLSVLLPVVISYLAWWTSRGASRRKR